MWCRCLRVAIDDGGDDGEGWRLNANYILECARSRDLFKRRAARGDGILTLISRMVVVRMYAGLLNPERKRKAIPLALQGAVVMAFGLTIAYLMYRLTSDDDDDGNTIQLVRTPGF